MGGAALLAACAAPAAPTATPAPAKPTGAAAAATTTGAPAAGASTTTSAAPAAGTATTPSAATAAKPGAGGTANFAVTSDPLLNPILTGDVSGVVMTKLLFNGLTRPDRETLEPKPD